MRGNQTPKELCVSDNGQKFIMKFAGMNNYGHKSVFEPLFGDAHARVGIKLIEVG